MSPSRFVSRLATSTVPAGVTCTGCGKPATRNSPSLWRCMVPACPCFMQGVVACNHEPKKNPKDDRRCDLIKDHKGDHACGTHLSWPNEADPRPGDTALSLSTTESVVLRFHLGLCEPLEPADMLAVEQMLFGRGMLLGMITEKSVTSKGIVALGNLLSPLALGILRERLSSDEEHLAAVRELATFGLLDNWERKNYPLKREEALAFLQKLDNVSGYRRVGWIDSKPSDAAYVPSPSPPPASTKHTPATRMPAPWNPDVVVEQFLREWNATFPNEIQRDRIVQNLRGKLRDAFAAGAEEAGLEAIVDAYFEASHQKTDAPSPAEVEAPPAVTPEGFRGKAPPADSSAEASHQKTDTPSPVEVEAPPAVTPEGFRGKKNFFVDEVNGNDATGLLGCPDRPFRTHAAGLLAMNSGIGTPGAQPRTLDRDTLNELTRHAEWLVNAGCNGVSDVGRTTAVPKIMGEIDAVAQRAFLMGQVSERANGYLPVDQVNRLASVISQKTDGLLTLTFNQDSPGSLSWSAETDSIVGAGATQIDALTMLLQQIIEEKEKKLDALRQAQKETLDALKEQVALLQGLMKKRSGL